MELYDLTPEVAVIVPHAPEPTVVVELRRATRTFCQDSTAWRRPFQAYAIAGLSQISIDPVEQAALIEVKWLKHAGRFIERRGGKALESHAQQGRPQAYYHYAGDDLVLAPVPDKDYVLDGEQILQPLRTSMEIPDWLGDKWGDAIVALTAAWLMAMPDKVWSNAAEAQTQMMRYQGLVSDAKRDAEGGGGGTCRTVQYGGL